MTARHILVTGASSGIGRALAQGFLAAGRRVTGIDVSPAAIEHGAYAHASADITDEAALAEAFRLAFAREPVDAVFANAALTDPEHAAAVDLDYARWQRILRVNVDGAFLTGRLAARLMSERRSGTIVFITSSLAFLSSAKAHDAPYCASKSAVEMLMRVLALELAPDGINVTTLFPSVMVDTGFFAHAGAEARAAMARPDLLNAAALFLADLPGGTLSGVSVDQQRFDEDPSYRAALIGNEIHA